MKEGASDARHLGLTDGASGIRRMTGWGGVAGEGKIQALVYDMLPLEEGAGKQCSEYVSMIQKNAPTCWFRESTLSPVQNAHSLLYSVVHIQWVSRTMHTHVFWVHFRLFRMRIVWFRCTSTCQECILRVQNAQSLVESAQPLIQNAQILVQRA